MLTLVSDTQPAGGGGHVGSSESDLHSAAHSTHEHGTPAGKLSGLSAPGQPLPSRDGQGDSPVLIQKLISSYLELKWCGLYFLCWGHCSWWIVSSCIYLPGLSLSYSIKCGFNGVSRETCPVQPCWWVGFQLPSRTRPLPDSSRLCS